MYSIVEIHRGAQIDTKLDSDWDTIVIGIYIYGYNDNIQQYILILYTDVCQKTTLNRINRYSLKVIEDKRLTTVLIACSCQEDHVAFVKN